MVLPSAPLGEHPDGDPFAEADRARLANSRLGRMEARAQLEEQQRLQQLQDQQPPQPPHQHQHEQARYQSHPQDHLQSQSHSYASDSPSSSAGRAFAVAPPQPRTGQRNSSRLQGNKRREPDLIISDPEDLVFNGSSTSSAPLAMRESPNLKPTSAMKKRAREDDLADATSFGTSDARIQRTRTRSPSQELLIETSPRMQVDGASSTTAARVGMGAAAGVRVGGAVGDGAWLSTPVATRFGRESSLSSIATSPQNSPQPHDDERPPSAGADRRTDPARPSSELNHSAADRDEPSSPEMGTVDVSHQSEDDSSVEANGTPAGNGPAARDLAPHSSAYEESSQAFSPGTAFARSPSPKAPRPPAMMAIRLTYAIPPPGTSNGVPQASIAEMAREAGYDQTRDEVDHDGSSEGDDDPSDGSDNDDGDVKKRTEPATVKVAAPSVPPVKKRKRAPNTILGRFGGYDVEDPFVDDSEINLYEPKFTAQPKRAGYHVCVGPVAIVTKNHRGRLPGSKNKPKPDPNAPTTNTPLAGSAHERQGTQAAEHRAGSALPSFGTAGQGEGGPPIKPARKKGAFSAELQAEIEKLKAEIAKESFEVKNKFPPRLRPILVDVALCALELGEYDDDFFAVMPKIFPYNLFTMKKLIKREVYSKRMALLEAEQDRTIEMMRRGVEESLLRQKREFAAAHAVWKDERARWEEEHRGRLENGGKTSDPAPLGFPSVAGVSGVPGSPGSESAVASYGEDGPAEPRFKFRFNEPLRLALYQACEIGDKMSELTVEKQELEKAVEHGQKAHSAMNDRKVLYNKIQALWSEGDMTSNQLSREMSAAKAKVHKLRNA